MIRERFGSSEPPSEPRPSGGRPNTPPPTPRSEFASNNRRHVFCYACMSVGLLYCGFGWQRCAVRANVAAHGTFHDMPPQLRGGAVPSPELHGLEGIAAKTSMSAA